MFVKVILNYMKIALFKLLKDPYNLSGWKFYEVKLKPSDVNWIEFKWKIIIKWQNKSILENIVGVIFYYFDIFCYVNFSFIISDSVNQ